MYATLRLQIVADHPRNAIMSGPNRPIPLFAAAAVLVAAGCTASGPRAAPSPVSASARSCLVVPPAPAPDSVVGAGHGHDDIEVALQHAVDPASAPEARGGSARLVFRQLYETLVRLDCRGHVRPGLAASWSHDAVGTRWSFTLRPDAHFWDGAPVTAQAVARSWSAAGDHGSVAGRPLIASERITGQRKLTVLLARPSTTAATFAQPALAVTGVGAYGSWPVGSGPYRPVAPVGLPPGDIRLVADARGQGADSITFHVLGSTGARAALDRGVDVLVSADPDVLAYARALPGFTTVPLPWSRTYVVAAADTGEADEGPPPAVPVEDLERLARGAVQVDARPAQPPFWWRKNACTAIGSPPQDTAARRRFASSRARGRASSPRIVFPAGDAAARSLAERLVGLAGVGAATPRWLTEAIPGLGAVRGSVVSAGVDPATLVRAVRAGDALAFVVPVPRAPAGPCVSALLGAGDEMVGAVLSPAEGLRITPLLDVRSSVVIRRGTADIAVDGDGTLIFRAPGGAP